jgi:superfamily I DNA/RNA helicase
VSISPIAETIDLAEDFEIREQVQADLLRRITEAPVDSRAALSDYVPTADEHQYKVIHADEHTVRLVAPAGSGKTQTVVNRVLNLVKHGAHPDRILVLTFDTSAAKALRDKMSEQTQVARTSLRNFQVSTLNAFGYGILREYLGGEFKPIVSKSQTRGLIYSMKRDLADAGRDKAELLPTNVRDRVYFEFFSLLKNELVDPRNIDKQTFADFVCASPHAEPLLLNALPLGMAAQKTQLSAEQLACLKTVIQILLWMYKGYEGKLRALNVIDFDDQKLRAHISLQGNRSLLGDVQSRFDEGHRGRHRAILKRPGRFDRVIQFKNPDAALRREYYSKLSPVLAGEQIAHSVHNRRSDR